jgi:phosphate starvation-inducible membrane PsiE
MPIDLQKLLTTMSRSLLHLCMPQISSDYLILRFAFLWHNNEATLNLIDSIVMLIFFQEIAMFTKIQKTLTHFAYQKARYNPFP